MSLYHFAKRLQEAGLGGLEFIAQIPGTVGGALVMNAGFGKDETGKRQEISNRLVEVNCLTPEGDFKRLSKKEIQFGYRRSSLKDCLILQAVFELVPRDPQTIQAQMIENSEYRKKGQDWSHPSAGSVFKNPPEGPTVGEMVEKLGLKGLRAGQAQISKIHGNFIVNLGGATAREVLSLIELIREKVRDAYHVELELEICHVGK
jgi:UDP-N-acetylmuramate dehydrogenase